MPEMHMCVCMSCNRSTTHLHGTTKEIMDIRRKSIRKLTQQATTAQIDAQARLRCRRACKQDVHKPQDGVRMLGECVGLWFGRGGG